MEGYILYNDEMDYTCNCPVYKNKKEALMAAASKCRHHSVITVDESVCSKPCHPVVELKKCESCHCFAGKA